MYLVKHILIILPAKKDDIIRIRYALIVLDIPWLNANIAPKVAQSVWNLPLRSYFLWTFRKPEKMFLITTMYVSW